MKERSNDGKKYRRNNRTNKGKNECTIKMINNQAIMNQANKWMS